MKRFILFLTLSRIFFGPLIFILAVFLSMYWLALTLFVFSAITDFFDGMLARKYDLVSEIGQMLDPIADKVLLVFSLIAIITLMSDYFISMMASLIIAREVWVSGLREFSSSMQFTQSTQVSNLGKIKTSIQFVCICAYFLGFHLNNSLILFLSNFLLFIALLLGLKSGIRYTESLMKSINRDT